jgi:hypothetical protein
MNPLLHYLSLHQSRTFVDSPELARRREALREHERAASERRAQRRPDRIRQAVAVLMTRRQDDERELATGVPPSTPPARPIVPVSR